MFPFYGSDDNMQAAQGPHDNSDFIVFVIGLVSVIGCFVFSLLMICLIFSAMWELVW